MLRENVAEATGVAGFSHGASFQDPSNGPVTPALGRQMLEENELKASLGYIARP